MKILFDTREEFLKNAHPEIDTIDYRSDVVGEFMKTQDIPEGAEVNLWFEQDVFCQVNLWFTCYLFDHFNVRNDIYLVMPEKQTQYGFAWYKPNQLLGLWKKRKQFVHMKSFAHLWECYAKNEVEALDNAGRELHMEYPFLVSAIGAYLESIPNNEWLGRPVNALQIIVKELGTNQFGAVFQEFCKRESIYGYGDLQVKRLMESNGMLD